MKHHFLNRKVLLRTVFLLQLILLTGLLSLPASAASKAVARINSKNYTSLEAAFKAVKKGQTVTLLKDVSTKKTIKINKKVSFTFNMNGKKIKPGKEQDLDCSYMPSVPLLSVNKASVTIKNGKINGDKKNWISLDIQSKAKVKLTGGSYGFIVSSGALTINGGTYGSLSQTKGKLSVSKASLKNASWGMEKTTASFKNVKGKNSSVTVYNSKLTLQKGSWSNTSFNFLNGSKVTIKSGTYTKSTDYPLFQMSDKSTLTVQDGTFTQKHKSGSSVFYVEEGGTLKYKGGTTSAVQCAVSIYGGSARISGGSLKARISSADADGYGSGIATCSADIDSTLEITGGTITNEKGAALSVDTPKKFTLTGGTISVGSASKLAPVQVTITGTHNADYEFAKWLIRQIGNTIQAKYIKENKNADFELYEEDLTEEEVAFAENYHTRIACSYL